MAWVEAVTCTLLKGWEPEAVLRKTSFWVMEDYCLKEDARPGWLVRPDVLIDRSPLE
jgi:hypothetical protein